MATAIVTDYHNDMSWWCQQLSTTGHRHCRKENCKCECHNYYNPKNYTKNSIRRVKRLG